MPTQQLQNEILELTKDLIRIPSTHSRQNDIQACAEFIGDWLTRYNIPFTKLVSGSTPSILVLPKPGYAPVLFMSHFDVVEVENEKLFEPVERDGRLYGRGSIDDKYGVAISLVLFREYFKKILADGLPLSALQFGLLFTGDEEVGGANGAKIASEAVSTDFFMAIDGGRPELIVTKEKGVMLLELTATGKASHAARPWLGQNAFDILIKDYGMIQQLFTEETEDHWHKTMVMSKAKVGNGSTNIVPEKATAIFDIRYTEHDDPHTIINSIENVVESSVTIHAVEPVFNSGPSPYLDLLVEQVEGVRVGFEHGASDARYLSQLGMPGVIWGADGEMSQHSDDEHIVISSLFYLYDKFDKFLNILHSR